jgi:hypothetical protein
MSGQCAISIQSLRRGSNNDVQVTPFSNDDRVFGPNAGRRPSIGRSDRAFLRGTELASSVFPSLERMPSRKPCFAAFQPAFGFCLSHQPSKLAYLGQSPRERSLIDIRRSLDRDEPPFHRLLQRANKGRWG